MKIAFDASPVVADRMTGIGYCAAGQMTAVIKQHPEDKFELQYMASKEIAKKKMRVRRYKKHNVTVRSVRFSNFIYRAVQNFIPLPYSLFFKGSYDVTHFFNYIVPPGVKGASVVTVHDMVYKAYPETMNFKTRFMFDLSLKRSMKRADLIVTDSEFSKSEIIKYFPKFGEKIRVIPCGVDRKRFNPEIESSETARVKIKYGIHGDYFLYLGTLEPRKNLVRLLKAYIALCSENKEAPPLVVAGGSGWQYEEIFKTAEAAGLKDKVIFTRYVPDKELPPLIKGAMAFLFPSLYEGFGLPPLEAMSCGVPVLVSEGTSLSEVVGDCGVCVDAFDLESIKQGMKRLAEDPELRKDLSVRGAARAENFTWGNSGWMLYEVYKEAVSIHEKRKDTSS